MFKGNMGAREIKLLKTQAAGLRSQAKADPDKREVLTAAAKALDEQIAAFRATL